MALQNGKRTDGPFLTRTPRLLNFVLKLIDFVLKFITVFVPVPSNWAGENLQSGDIMNQTARAPYSDQTGDPSRLTPLEIALSRCSWCPTALSDENDELFALERSHNDTHLFSDRDLRTTRTRPKELSEKAVQGSSDLQIGYEAAVAANASRSGEKALWI